MANTKISQLPSYTGTAADLRWFVMNNSGETETFKFSGYTSPFRVGSGSNSIIAYYLTPDKALGDYSFVVGQTNYVASTGTNNAVIGGLNNRVNENNQNFIGGGENNATGGGKNSAVIGGNTLVAYGENCFIAGGQSSNAVGVNSVTLGGLRQTAGNSYSAYLFCGVDNTYQAGGDSGNGILGGENNAMVANGGKGISIIGGTQNKYLSAPTLGGNFDKSSGSIIGGFSNRIEGLTTNANGEHAFPLIFGGSSNKIFGATTSATSGASIINSFSSTITSSSGSTILGGFGNTISGKTNVVMIGTSGRTASASTTTYVENIHSYRTPSTEVQPVFSGSVFTCNLENGAKSQFYITGTSTINITNVRDGASFMIKTQTDGNYVMTWTATGGYTFVFEGGIKDPGNNVTDIFVFEVFGSVIYGNRRHNYS
jgi:hypothetical protein